MTRVGPGAEKGLARPAVPCTSMCRMPQGYFYACQGNSVIYGRPGPFRHVINTPGPVLLFHWRTLSPCPLSGLPLLPPWVLYPRGLPGDVLLMQLSPVVAQLSLGTRASM